MFIERERKFEFLNHLQSYMFYTLFIHFFWCRGHCAVQRTT